MRKVVHPELLGGALYNCDPASASDPQYAKGIVVGIVSALMADGMTWDRALDAVAHVWRDEYDLGVVPDEWRSTLIMKIVNYQRSGHASDRP